MTELPPCDRCKRPARRRALYGRASDGVCILWGRYGGACFYKMADYIASFGYQPETEQARIIYLRGAKS